MFSLFKTFSLQELRHHPWRNAAAVVAVMLGVALAFSVQLINASALSEFTSAARSVNGQPDLELRAAQGWLDESFYARLAQQPGVALASPVLELNTRARASGSHTAPVALRLAGVDALLVARTAPSLMPMPAAGSDRFTLFAPDAVFLSAAARRTLGLPGVAGTEPEFIDMQTGMKLQRLRVAGQVGASAAVAVMDIGAAQDFFGQAGQLSRIDVRLRPGSTRESLLADLNLPAGVSATAPGESAQRIGELSRAYRVNLTVLALVALFTGAFLVFSVLSLSVAQRAQQFALLGVLGLTARQRLGLVLGESLALGLVGSAAGLALGTGLATLALRWAGGDLGGGYFEGVAPQLQWDTAAALLYASLGVAAALVGGWWPASRVGELPLAQTLKGLGLAMGGRLRRWPGPLLMAIGCVLALLPPIGGLPLAAYASVALLLLGGIGSLPWLVSALYDRAITPLSRHLLPMLAVERARRVRDSAAVAIGGVVAALSLAVALTVMVASFRDSVTHWLDVVLPADLYLRTGSGAGSADTLFLDPAFVQALPQVPGVRRIGVARSRSLSLDPGRPRVTLLARELDDAANQLPLLAPPLAAPAGQVAIYVSEPLVDLYGARLGQPFALLDGVLIPSQSNGPAPRFFVAGVWRDYARQFGSIAMDLRDLRALTGDARVNDVALWLAPQASAPAVEQAVRELAERQAGAGSSALLEMASTAQIRNITLRIFDRSFAVTYWLQAVAIAIGLFGIAASFSAQVLARRKEFGLLVHLGLTRRQILAVVAGEGAAWSVIGTAAGLALGLAVSVVLVHVVNPQSFHWSMDMALPLARLCGLGAAVVLAGTVTAWLSARAAANHDAVLAVKEDW